MRHAKKRSKLSMMGSHRKATLKNMVRSLLKYQKIETTLARAKEARRVAEHLITISRTDTIAARRNAYAILNDHILVSKLFREIMPLFKERSGGYTRIIPLGFRRGDGATLAILELTEKKIIAKPSKAKAKPKAEAVKGEGEKASGAPKHEKPKEAHEKEEPKAKIAPKAKATHEEEKRAEKAKMEDKKIGDKKNFLKNLRGFFHRKTDM